MPTVLTHTDINYAVSGGINLPCGTIVIKETSHKAPDITPTVSSSSDVPWNIPSVNFIQKTILYLIF